jgi:hypothetical protein
MCMPAHWITCAHWITRTQVAFKQCNRIRRRDKCTYSILPQGNRMMTRKEGEWVDAR